MSKPHILTRISESRWSLPAIFFLAVVLRVAFAFYVYPTRWNMDPDGYDGLALNLVRHGELSSELYGRHAMFREPGWPILLAIPYALGGRNIAGIVLFQLFFALGSIALLYRLGVRYFSRKAGFLAALIMAAHPSLVYYTVYPFREVAYLFFGLLGFQALLLAAENPTRRGFAWAGALQAWTGLISTTALPFSLIAPLAVKLFRRDAPLKALAAFYLALGAVYSPWPIRNYVEWHAFIPGTLFAAENLYKVMLVPHEARATVTEARILHDDPIYRKWMEISPREPALANRLFTDAIKARLKDDPLEIFSKMPFHAWKFWRPFPYKRLGYTMGYRKLFWAGVLSDGWLIPLGWIGLLMGVAWPRSRKFSQSLRPGVFEGLAAASVLALTATHAASFAMTRHRLPIMGYVILFAAVPLAKVSRHGEPRQ